MRMVQELVQALARVQFLKQRAEFAQALDEIDRTLKKFWNLNPGQRLSLEQLLAVCRGEGGAEAESMVALADLLNEQGDLHALQDKTEESRQSYALALGLYLETLLTSVISMDLIAKVERLVERTQGARLPVEVLKRLLSYYEARGMLAKAEDVLFDWLDTSDPDAPAGGLAFYERLARKSDTELTQGDLPREEVEAGRREVLQRAAPP